MDTFLQLYGLLNANDKKLFRQLIRQKNKRHDVKNLELLKLIETDDINGLNKLYKPGKNKDAYHALHKRLQDSLLLFLSQRTFENNSSETYDALRLVVAGRFLLENDVPKIAFKCLAKAEQLAVRLEQYNLLNELLLLKLQYAHLPGAEDLESLTVRFTANQGNMQREAKLNLAYAFLRRELQEIHLKGKIVDLTNLMIAIIRKYRIAEEDLMSYRAIYQILYIANEYAAIQQNYQLIERFIGRTDKFMQHHADGDRSKLFYHISIVYYLANFYLRQREFDKCSGYLKEMLELMNTDSQYHSVFHLRYQLLYSLNLYYTGFAADAIVQLTDTLSTAKRNAKPEELEDLRVCLTMFLALRNDRQSLKQLALLTRTDAWYEKQMGMLWTIRKHLMEILIHSQFSNIDLAMSRVNSFKRRYKKYLQKTSEDRVMFYLNLVEKYLLKPNIEADPAFKTAVLSMLNKPENNDIFTLSFIAWLIARWENKTAYEVVLGLM